MRSAKSIGNMPRYTVNNRPIVESSSSSSGSRKDERRSTTTKTNANKPAAAAKHRSKSVDIRLRSFFCATSSVDPTSKLAAAAKKGGSPPTLTPKAATTTKPSTQDDSKVHASVPNKATTSSRTSCLMRLSKMSNPLTRKSYDSLTWSSLPKSGVAPDFKQLERKNELERQRLSEIMAKLEVDLAQARQELLLDDDFVRLTTSTTSTTTTTSDFLRPKYQKAPQASYNNINIAFS